MRRKLKLKELNRPDLENFRALAKNPVSIIIDNVRSGINVGSIFRTADAFALEKIYLVGITPKPPHREITKSAIGATESVDWEYHQKIEPLLNDLSASGACILAVEQTTDSVYLNEFSFQPEKPIVLIVGNEITGVSEQGISLADGCLEIPQYGTKHSLNVSVCTGIVIYEVCRKLSLLVS